MMQTKQTRSALRITMTKNTKRKTRNQDVTNIATNFVYRLMRLFIQMMRYRLGTVINFHLMFKPIFNCKQTSHLLKLLEKKKIIYPF